MCCLFGVLDYQERLSLARRRQMLAVLARECEARGTDAAGIAYCVNRHMSVYKAPKPAHLVNFQPPAQARFIMGHTRMATQGDEHCNYNNHPFKGRAGSTSFALAHNGVIHNDQLLKVQYQLPKTKIETDSYVAVQLLEKSGRLDFHSLRKMAEVMQGTFTFTVLDDRNNLYIVKGNNPMCIYHFPREGFYIYASTSEILSEAVKKLHLNRRHRKEIPLKQGEILKITPEGSRHVEQFQNDYLLQSTFNLYGWGGRYPYYPTYPTYPTHPSTTPDEEQPSYLEELMEFGESIGVMREDQQLLLDAGYTWMDLEEMFYDPMLLDVCLRDAACPVCGGLPMKTLLLEPGKLAKEIDIPHELSEMQRIVGGTIQAIYPFPEQAAVVCNDEGLLLGLPLNRVIDTGIVIAGTCFICGLGEEDFTDLPTDLMERFKECYYWPRQFIRLNGELIALPYDPETK